MREHWKYRAHPHYASVAQQDNTRRLSLQRAVWQTIETGLYGKIFASMYDGTLVEDWRALVTFQQMIVLCDADGVVDMTPAALSRRTGIPIDHIKAGIEVLEGEDPYSRTAGSDGRRIERLDEHRPWGWVIVNHAKYRGMQDADTVREQNRERKRRQRAKEGGHGSSRSVTDGHGPSRHTDTDTDTRTTAKAVVVENASVSTCPYAEIVDLYHEILPELPAYRKRTNARDRAMRARWRNNLDSLDLWRRYFDYVRESDFLMGRLDKARPFHADLEWLCREANYVKVYEGKYHG